MNDRRLQYRLILAVVVLALWTGDAVASSVRRCAEVHGWLFTVSLEELMEMPIDAPDGGRWYDADTLEVSVRRPKATGDYHAPIESAMANDETEATPISIALDNVDHGL